MNSVHAWLPRSLLAIWFGSLLYCPSSVSAFPITLDGRWTIWGDVMTAPSGYFTGTGTGAQTIAGATTIDFVVPSNYIVNISITDLFVISDDYELYDNGALIGTSMMPDWDALSLADPFVSPPFTVDPNIAIANGYFAGFNFMFNTGSHSLAIREVSTPSGFIDATVAFKGSYVVPEQSVAVPEPATLSLLTLGFLGAGCARRLVRPSMTPRA